jgi:hypothetical protein
MRTHGRFICVMRWIGIAPAPEEKESGIKDILDALNDNVSDSNRFEPVLKTVAKR